MIQSSGNVVLEAADEIIGLWFIYFQVSLCCVF